MLQWIAALVCFGIGSLCTYLIIRHDRQETLNDTGKVPAAVQV